MNEISTDVASMNHYKVSTVNFMTL